MKNMNNRNLVLALVGLLALAAAVFGYNLTSNRNEETGSPKGSLAKKAEAKLQDACASTATYARLKEVAFEEAVRIRNADPANLDTLAASVVVRMENPHVKSRDEDLNVTVCSGRFVLELPPGAEGGFAGERRLVADIEYAAQAAADGSGLVYQMKGAEPIIYKLANFDLNGRRPQPQAPAEETRLAEAAPAMSEPQEVEPEPEPQPQPRTVPPPPPVREARPPRTEPRPVVVAKREEPEPRPQPIRTEARANPSFNCNQAGTRSERMVCSSRRLASRDRQMSSMFYSALADADARKKRELRRTRDRFLAYRERCGDEDCIAEAYEGRMREIHDIMEAE
jgi:uncharacterized protein YecT (DUF1311 family)